MSMRWKAATTGLIYKKVLQLDQTTLIKVKSGYLMDLVAGDIQRFDKSILHLWSITLALLQTFVLIVLTWYLLGYQALGGIAFLVCVGTSYVIMGRACTELRFKTAKVTDKRLNSMNAIVPGIRVVKMHAWEWSFADVITLLRRQEVRLIRLKNIILTTVSALKYPCQSIATCISIAVLSACGVQLTAFNMMVTLALTSTTAGIVSVRVALPTNSLPQFFAAIGRIQSFLELSDFQQLTARETLQRSFNIFEKHHPQAQPNILTLDNVTCCVEEQVILKNVSLSVSKNEIVFVTGLVGSGKSSLLMAILKEIPPTRGTILCSGKIAHVQQLAWIFTGTVQENILFGQPMRPERYKVVLEACALIEDINSFPNDDMTMIGERGVLLSGGQRARVDLARAVYADADVYLMDDPLSAVDAKVGRFIFEKCICGLLAQKTRIVVTHCQQYLINAERIVIVNEGSITREGSYTELRDAGVEFNEMSKETVNPRRLQSIQKSSRKIIEEDSVGLEAEAEDRSTGSVSWSLYWRYFRAARSPFLVISLALFFLMAQVVLILPDWWVLHMSSLPRSQWRQGPNLKIYAGLVTGALLFALVRSFLFYNTTLDSSQALHHSMLTAVLKAPVLFFDTNPVGRVLNRFSTDMAFMDEMLPDTLLDAIQIMLFCVGAIVLPSILNPWVILVAIPLIATFLFIGKYYTNTSRDLKRLEALNRSPVFSHFADTVEGLATIRSYKKNDMFLQELSSYQDTYNKTLFLQVASNRWLALRLDIICTCFVAAVLFISISSQSAAGATALSLVYALQLLADTAQYGVRQGADVENYMTSVERIISYTELEPEPGHENTTQPSEGWPQYGRIQMENVSLVYYPGGPQVLNDVSVTIKPRMRVGIAGRTGAGKSSLVAALFRMPEPTGRILIDGIDIQGLNIQSSRRVLSVIPQDPVLFTGTLRMNLDPFRNSRDGDIWQALGEAGLKAKIAKLPKQLYGEVLECGSNFSVGERQLLCLARALLHKRKVIVLDEATANVDYDTDRLIQQTIRDKFQECTVITIAHRLNTIMDYDKVIVMDKGRVVEFDEPQALLGKEGGVLLELYKSHTVGT